MKRSYHTYSILLLILFLSTHLASGFALHLHIAVSLFLSRYALIPSTDPMVFTRFPDIKARKEAVFRHIVEYCGFSSLFISLSQIYFAYIDLAKISFIRMFVLSFSVLLFFIIVMLLYKMDTLKIIWVIALYVLLHNIINNSQVLYILCQEIAQRVPNIAVFMALFLSAASYILFCKWEGVIYED